MNNASRRVIIAAKPAGPRIKHLLLTLLLLLALAAVSCTPRQMESYKPPLDKLGEVYLYLQPLPPQAQAITFTIAEISLVRPDGSQLPLAASLPPLSGRDQAGRQQRLAARAVEPGRYQGLAIRIGQATLLGEEGEMRLLASEQPLLVSQELTVVQGRALALFLVLAPEKLVGEGFGFTPLFSLAGPRRQPANLLGFVSSAAANVVSVFDKQDMEIVKQIAVDGGPKGLALDRARGRLYVALNSTGEIVVIDAATTEIIGRIKLHFGDEPTELILAGSGETLVCTNYGSSTVSIVDASSLAETGRISFESEPTWLVAAASGRQAYVLRSQSNLISIIDLTGANVVANITLDESPIRGALSPDGKMLYVIAGFAPDLLVIDPSGLAVTRRIFVGNGAISLTVDAKTGFIYLGKKTGEIAVLDPSSLMFIDHIPALAAADFLAIDNEANALFMVSTGAGLVDKIDLVGKRRLAGLETEEGAHAVVTMGK